MTPPLQHSRACRSAPARRGGSTRILSGEDGAALRISVKGGGCSGFQYAFDIDRTRAEDDLVVHARRRDRAGRSGLARNDEGRGARFRRRPDGAVVQGQEPECGRLVRLRGEFLGLAGQRLISAAGLGLRHSHKSNSRYCSSSSVGPLSFSFSAKRGKENPSLRGRKIEAPFLPRIEPFQRVAPAPRPFCNAASRSGSTPRPFPTSKTRGRNSKSVGAKSKPLGTKSKSDGNETKSGGTKSKPHFLP